MKTEFEENNIPSIFLKSNNLNSHETKHMIIVTTYTFYITMRLSSEARVFLVFVVE
jgi:hypothetical protein